VYQELIDLYFSVFILAIMEAVAFFLSTNISGGVKQQEYSIKYKGFLIFSFYILLKPQRLLLFCWQKSKQKTMSAASASLKIGYTTLKIRNLPFYARCV
jgi:hypothetical protein